MSNTEPGIYCYALDFYDGSNTVHLGVVSRLISTSGGGNTFEGYWAGCDEYVVDENLWIEHTETYVSPKLLGYWDDE